MKKIRELLYIYSEVFFSDSVLLGVVVLAVTFSDPNAGLCGLSGVLAAYGFSWLTFSSKVPREPYYFYNPLLVGLSVGALFNFSPGTLLLTVIASVLSIVLTITVGDLAKRHAGLPVLSVPFVLVSWLVYALAAKAPGFMAGLELKELPPEYAGMPAWLSGYFLALAGIFFSKKVLAGMLLAAGILVHSRIAFLLTLIGYYMGAAVSGFFGTGAGFFDLNYFNFILTAVAVGGIYLVPSVKAYIISALAVAISWLVLAALETFTGHVFTLPFNIAVLCFIYYAGTTNLSLRSAVFLKTPEENLDHSLAYSSRFGRNVFSVFLPFSGEWKVSQAFEDDVTHKGDWKYAVDFVLTDEEGKQFAGNPASPESYFAFGKPVLSPVSGTVVAAVNDVADNEIGSVNREHNWGNCVVVYDRRGFYAKVCHLKKGSVLPPPGMYVEAGQAVGACGNSGYSPFPHIHLHVQKDAGSPGVTVPFLLEQTVLPGGRFENKHLPAKGEVLSPLFGSVKKRKVFDLIMKDSFVFSLTVKRRGRTVLQKEETLEVVMDAFGYPYLGCGGAKLYFETSGNVFRFYGFSGTHGSALRFIFLALPSVPFSEYRSSWKDAVPMRVCAGRLFGNALLFLQSFYPGVAGSSARLEYIGNQTVACRNSVSFLGKEASAYLCTARIHGEKFVESVVIRHGGEEIELKRKV